MNEPKNSFLWCLLFGCFYFMVRGIWTHAVISILLAIITYGISWLIYPFFAKKIAMNHWKKTQGE